MTKKEEEELLAECRQLLERLVVPRLNEIKKQLDESDKRRQRWATEDADRNQHE